MLTDEDSKKSLLGKLDKCLEDAAAKQVAAVRRVVDPDLEDSPLNRWRTGIEKTIKDQVQSVLQVVLQLSEQVVAAKVGAQVFELTTQKGFSYEDKVHAVVSAASAPYGDLAERVGQVPGSRGNRRGDEVVVLNEADTFGKNAAIVLEIKDRKLGASKTFEELDAAMENRDALAGIAVFSSQANAPTSAPFHYVGNRAVVVLDKDELDERPLKLALLWARWVVRRQLGEASVDLDLGRVEELIDEGRGALKRVAVIRRCLSTGKKQVDEAIGHVSELANDIERVFDRLKAEIAA